MPAFMKSHTLPARGQQSAMQGCAVKIDSVRHTPDQIAAYRRAGWWTDTTTADMLDGHAREQPDRLSIANARTRLSYAEHARRSQRLASHFIQRGVTSDDVALQLPNRGEFAVAVNAAMLAGIPFCQVRSDFRSREIEFVLRYTGAATDDQDMPDHDSAGKDIFSHRGPTAGRWLTLW